MQSRSLVPALLLLAGCATLQSPTTPTVRVVGSRALANAPEVVSRVDPPYPDADRRAGVQGEVEVEVEVDQAGNVVKTRIVRAPSRTLGDAVAEAVAQWRFTPSQVDGKPVRVVFPVLVAMKL
ncbi:MAG TPA: TonB family protein [Thermoanaerobaculia bacterium]|jgi:protein TonB|nr:TonB family protein [Thermoanaerobaculia bacterium]